jgi:hypothetical protein
MKRVAIYIRVSASKQDTDNQRRELEAVADRSGWKVVKVYEDVRRARPPRRRAAQKISWHKQGHQWPNRTALPMKWYDAKADNPPGLRPLRKCGTWVRGKAYLLH